METLVRVFSFMAFATFVICETDLEKCESILTMPSRSTEVHCKCVKTFVDISLPLHKLIINQTGCDDREFYLKWNELEAYIGIKEVVFDNAVIKFSGRVSTTNFPLIEVIFHNSLIKEISRNAFFGLKLLEKIRFLNTQIGSIRSKSFSGFDKLQTIEFSESSIHRIEAQTFSDLPVLYEFGFIYSSIGTIDSNALELSRPPATQDCPLKARMAFPFMHDIMSRDLSTASNITLPDYGPRIFIFKSNISTIESRAIVANSFSYVIFGGNRIENMQSRALEAELNNKCDISALLLIRNEFEQVGSEFMAGITGDEDNLIMTTIALSNNVFENISPRAFLVNETLSLYAVEDNKIDCSCDNFHWILSDEDSKVQKDLEKDLVEKSFCFDGSPLETYLESYNAKCPPPPPTMTASSDSSSFQSSVSSTHNGLSLSSIFCLMVMSLMASIILSH